MRSLCDGLAIMTHVALIDVLGAPDVTILRNRSSPGEIVYSLRWNCGCLAQSPSDDIDAPQWTVQVRCPRHRAAWPDEDD
jgi:hypothetical protein